MRYITLLLVFYRTSLQTDMEYRADFYTRVVASVLGLATTVGALSVAYGYTTNIRGWSFSQALVLIAIYYLMEGLIETFIGPNLRAVMTQVRDGTLDFVLIKPVNAQFLASFRTVNIWRCANVLMGIALLVYTVSRLSLQIGWREAYYFTVTLGSGLVVMYAFWLTLVTLTFWFVRIDNLEQILWQAFEAGRYPMEIYPRWLQGSLTYVVPIAFIITVPARALAGRLGTGDALIAVLVALTSLTLSSAFWRWGTRHYTGASS
jgi:ABC-2 type transport system permease protein